MKKILFQISLIFVFAIVTVQVFATHNRAGEIMYEYIGPQSYRATVVTYTKISEESLLADRDTLRIDWGDGNSSIVTRTNGFDTDGDGIPEGVEIDNDIKQNIYVSEIHTYAGPADFYIISVLDLNRI
ncbi:MAG: hypothetical protein ACPG4Z_07685, partial [Chitinophagales bacterium]